MDTSTWLGTLSLTGKPRDCFGELCGDRESLLCRCIIVDLNDVHPSADKNAAAKTVVIKIVVYRLMIFDLSYFEGQL